MARVTPTCQLPRPGLVRPRRGYHQPGQRRCHCLACGGKRCCEARRTADGWRRGWWSGRDDPLHSADEKGDGGRRGREQLLLLLLLKRMQQVMRTGCCPGWWSESGDSLHSEDDRRSGARRVRVKRRQGSQLKQKQPQEQRRQMVTWQHQRLQCLLSCHHQPSRRSWGR